MDLSCYTAIVAADFEFEFGGRDGNLPRPVCMVAKELRSGKIWRQWRDELGPEPPFPIGADALFVSFTASAELGCFKVLGWPMPARILDLSAEYRNFRNLDYPRGTPKELREKKGLIDACRFFNIDMTGAGEKKAIRRRILEGEPYSEEERDAILEYCAGDVIPLEELLAAMGPHIDMPRALLRGRHEAAVAAMEYIGPPIDVPMLTAFREHWTGIQDDLIAKLDANFGVYEGRSFRRERFTELVGRLGITELATARERPTRSGRQNFQGHGENLSGPGAIARAPPFALVIAARRPGGRRRRAQSHQTLALQHQDRKEFAGARRIHLRTVALAARSDKARARVRCRLH